ncbi:MAG: nucleotidyltransferase family protein [Clostridiaceae bacterium]|nr:nucleotidyltransferase family protein [Clostridiaceae bacterium]
MNPTCKAFLKLIKSHIRNEEPNMDSDVNLEEVFSLACKHNLLPLVYDAASLLEYEGKERVRNHALYTMIGQTKRTFEFLKVYNFLVHNGLKPLVLKGLVARSLYQSPDLRISSDEDIYIRKEDYALCHDLLMRYGYRVGKTCANKDPKDAQAISYMAPNSDLCIEVHVNLFGLSGVRKELNKYFNESFDRCITLEIEGFEIYTLCHTDHFLFIFLHLYKHLIGYGVGIRQCMDLALFAKKFFEQICWEQIIAIVRELGCEQLLYSLFDIGINELGICLDISDIPFDGNIKVSNRMTLIVDMIEGGVFGKSCSERIFSGPVVQMAASSKKRMNVILGFVKACFPSKEYLKYSYLVLKKHSFLLPFVWVYRIIRYLKRTKEPAVVEGLGIARKRLSLLEEYGLVQ